VVKRITIGVAAALPLACGCFLLYSHHLSERAQSIVSTAFELTEQHQPPTVADIQKRFGSALRLDQCRASECGYRVVVSNQILAALQIVPQTEMESYFWAKDGVVFRNMVDYTTTLNHRYRIVSHVQIDFCVGCEAVSVHPWDTASPLDTNGIVEIGNEASVQSRRTVLCLNTACLTRLGGCESVADLLPTVWKQTAGKKLACVIQNDRGFVLKPRNWP
jgi:hypothetical protein